MTTTLKPPQAVVETLLDKVELLAILEVLPKGAENIKKGKELVSILIFKGVKMSTRKLREGVRQLRLHYGIVCIGIPGQGYYLAEKKEDIDRCTAYFKKMITEFVETQTALLSNWYNQPMRGSIQLDLIEMPLNPPEKPKEIPGVLVVLENNHDYGLTYDQAYDAIYFYWKLGLPSVEKVTERLQAKYGNGDRGITLSKVWGLWRGLDLPCRKQGGHGLKIDERQYQVCLRKLTQAYESGKESK